MKNSGILILSFVLLVGLFGWLVSAASSFPGLGNDGNTDGTNSGNSFLKDMNKFIDDSTNVLEPITALVLGTTPSGELLFAKFLFFIIIFGIIWTSLFRVEFFNEKMWVLVIVSISVSILATRWIVSDALVSTILLPYSTIGVAIAAGLPFLVYFVIVNIGMGDAKYRLVRKTAWIFFAVIFVVLWISRYESLISNNSPAGFIYPLTVVVALAMLIFDRSIQRYLAKMKLEKSTTNETLLVDLRRRMANAKRDLTDGLISNTEFDKIMKDLKSKYTKLS